MFATARLVRDQIMETKADRVLIVAPTDDVGGAERILQLLARQFAERGALVDVVVLARGDRGGWAELSPRVRLHYVSSPWVPFGGLLAMPLVWRLSRPTGFQLALASHVHCNGFLGVLRSLGLMRTKALIVRESTLVGERFSSVKRALLRSIYSMCYGGVDLVVCQTGRMQASLMRFAPSMATRHTIVLPNPIDLNLVRARSRESIQIPLPDRPFAVAVGRLVPVKGFGSLLDAYAGIPQDLRNFDLVMIGDGPERNALERRCELLGINASVRFLGHLPNPFPVVAQASFGVVSSVVEGFPNVIMEMLSLGLPVVTTECTGDLDELPNVTVCTAGSVTELTRAMTAVSSGVIPRVNQGDVDSYLNRRSPQAFAGLLLRHGEALQEGSDSVAATHQEL